MIKKIFLTSLAVTNLISQIFVFLLHQDKAAGIEAIRELNFYLLIPAILIVGITFIKHKISHKLLHFMGLLSLSIVIYVMAVHSGVREAVSLFQHPQYLLSLICSIGVIIFNDNA